MSVNPVTKLNELLLSLNPYEFTTLAFIIGIFLCDGLNYNQQQSLGNFFEQLGQTILTVGAQGQNLNEIVENANENIQDIVCQLKRKIGNLEQFIAEFKNL